MIYKLIAIAVFAGVYTAWGWPGAISVLSAVIIAHVVYRLVTGQWMPPA